MSTIEASSPHTSTERTSLRSGRAQERRAFRARRDAAYAPVKKIRDQYHQAFLKAKHDTDPLLVVVRQQYRAAFKQYEQFIFETEGFEASQRAREAEAWKARPYVRVGGKAITPEDMTVTVAVGSVAVPAIVAAPIAAAFHLGGTAFWALVATGAAFGEGARRVIKPLDKSIQEEFAAKELLARQAGQSVDEFRKENIELFKRRAKSIKKRRIARLATSVGFTTATVVTTGVLTPDHVGHSAGQWAAKGADSFLHHIGLSDGLADYLAEGTGAYQAFQVLLHKFGAGAGAILQELFGVKAAAAAELPAGTRPGVVMAGYVPQTGPEVVADIKTQLITHFGSAPWATTREAAFTPRSISEAADMLIRGGMNPEARQAFIDAATLQRTNPSPDFVEFTKREWEAQAFRVRGVPHVLGEGADRVLFDASRDPSFRGGIPPLYRAEQFSFSYTDARGISHTVVIDVPQGRVVDGRQVCENFSLFTDTAATPIPATPAEVVAQVTPQPEALRVVSRAVWSEQTGFVAQDCTDTCSGDKITTVRILNYSGESVTEAHEYMLASIRETSAWADYQKGMHTRFAYFKFHNTLTGTDTFECLQLDTGHFDVPQNVVNGRSIPVTTQAQFDGLITGTGEEWRMTGATRGADISVLHPKDPIPLVEVRDSSGRLTGFAIGGEDTNGDGILQRSEQGRSLTEVVNNQIYVVGNDIVSQETGSTATDAAAQAKLERVFLSRIPQDFIDGRTESARFNALQEAFGQSASRPDGLTRDELNELGRWIHYYGELHKDGLNTTKGAASFTNPDGSPKVIFQFFREGITTSAQPTDGSRGDFADLRRSN